MFACVRPGVHVSVALGEDYWERFSGEWVDAASGRTNRTLVNVGGRAHRVLRLVGAGVIAASYEECFGFDSCQFRGLSPTGALLLGILVGEGLPRLWKATQLGRRCRVTQRQVRRLLRDAKGRGLIDTQRAGSRGSWVREGPVLLRTRSTCLEPESAGRS